MSTRCLDQNRVRGIVFDLDGTLIDSYDAIAESLNSALEKLGRAPLPVAQVRRMVGSGLETLIERALGGSPIAAPEEIARAVRLFRERYDRICVESTCLLPGVKRTLETLKLRGYRMAVATNKPSYFARRLLEALSVGSCLDIVLGPDLVTHPKPHPEMVLAALSAMNFERPEAIYVGDMDLDVQTARAAGLAAVVIPTGSSSAAELEAARADMVLPDFVSLLDLLVGPLLESQTS